MARESFEPDVFDDLPDDGTPVGAHRAPQPWWTRLLATFVFLAVGGGIAYGLATLVYNKEAAPVVTPNFTPSPVVTPSVTPEPVITPSVTPSPDPVIILDATVVVYNDAGISGLAGRVAGQVEEAGFTDVTASNWTGASLAQNTVQYASDDMRDSAELIAATLGITTVTQAATNGTNDIQVVLVSDI